MKSNEIYPSYFLRSDRSIVAINSKDKMFIVYPKGRNKNPGVTLDHYITRKMVLLYYGCGRRISSDDFKRRYETIYSSYLTHILNATGSDTGE